MGDLSQPSSFGPLPRVIEKTNNVIVGSGMLDYLLLTNGTLMTLNNMTFNGAQGFTSKPSGKFFVPYNPSIGMVVQETETQPIPATPVGLVGGGGLLGTTHTERGLTWVTVDLAGHGKFGVWLLSRADGCRNSSVRAGSVVPPAGVLARSHKELDRAGKLHDARWELHWDCAGFAVLQQCHECDAECHGDGLCSVRIGMRRRSDEAAYTLGSNEVADEMSVADATLLE